METFLDINIIFFFLRFKSYYVVWKLFSVKGKAYTMSRLNRTM